LTGIPATPRIWGDSEVLAPSEEAEMARIAGGFASVVAALGFATPALPAEELIFGDTFEGTGYSRWTFVVTPQVPQAGELVINEVMANPASPETDREWFELKNPTARTLDLSGCVVDGSPRFAGVFPLVPGAVAVVGQSSDTSVNGGIVPTVVSTFALSNTTDTLTISCFGTAIDVVSWASTSDSDSYSLDPDFASAALNDDSGGWCYNLSDSYGDGTAGTGTPGASNPHCT
jgi:hypothetical protein